MEKELDEKIEEIEELRDENTNLIIKLDNLEDKLSDMMSDFEDIYNIVKKY